MIAKMFREDSAKLPSDLDRAKQRGLPLTIDDIQKLEPTVPDAENAAPLYRRATRVYASIYGTGGMFQSSEKPNENWRTMIHRRYLKFRPVLALVKQAALLPQCNFGAGLDSGYLSYSPSGKQFIEARELREVGYGTIRAAIEEQRSGNINGAFEDINAALVLANRAPAYAPVFIGSWGADIDMMAFQTLFRIAQVHWQDPTVLRRIDHLTRRIELPNFYKSLETEFVLGLDSVHRIKSLEEVGLDQNTPKAFSKTLDALYQAPGVKEAFEERYLHVYLEFFKRLPADPQDWVKIHLVLKKFRKELNDDMSVDNAIARQIAPAYPGAPLSNGAVEAAKRILLTTVAILKVHRDQEPFPSTLPISGTDTIDPLSGKSLRYRKEFDGFTLYSVGVNMIDDGGKAVYGPTPLNPRPDDIVFRFRYPRVIIQ
jgi:hypothetical protein